MELDKVAQEPAYSSIYLILAKIYSPPDYIIRLSYYAGFLTGLLHPV